ncbi:MAG: type 4a pilus biogenesis protein PilO [Alphaproteobacteria bacterium]|nr:type 4a pilus biogenesis protein PilO [Alphaproteobacteria bacterium]MCD8570613.1 type 4a pilus biogenesis protein PilO [Alphaproteobacteria bacterium]
MTKEDLQGREVIIELHQIGQFVKATAMDVMTLTEVSIQGPASAPESTLKMNAVKRLEYVLRKKGLIS